MFTRAWLLDAAERAVRAFAWSVLSFLGGADVLDAFHADWVDVLGVGAGAAVLSLLASAAATQVADPRSASLVDVPGKHAADR